MNEVFWYDFWVLKNCEILVTILARNLKIYNCDFCDWIFGSERGIFLWLVSLRKRWNVCYNTGKNFEKITMTFVIIFLEGSSANCENDSASESAQ